MSELKLSEEYLNRMRDLLGEEEFSAYLKSFDEERLYGLRVNTRERNVRPRIPIITPDSITCRSPAP